MEPKADGGHGGHGVHGMHAIITMSPNGDKQKFLLEDVEEITIIPR